MTGWHKGDKKPGWWEILIGPGKGLDTKNTLQSAQTYSGYQRNNRTIKHQSRNRKKNME